jgi:hypothetical protein
MTVSCMAPLGLGCVKVGAALEAGSRIKAKSTARARLSHHVRVLKVIALVR